MNIWSILQECLAQRFYSHVVASASAFLDNEPQLFLDEAVLVLSVSLCNNTGRLSNNSGDRLKNIWVGRSSAKMHSSSQERTSDLQNILSLQQSKKYKLLFRKTEKEIKIQVNLNLVNQCQYPLAGRTLDPVRVW